MPELRAFAICPTCSELYPSFRGCPSCDGERAGPVREVTAPRQPPAPAEMVAVEAAPGAVASAGSRVNLVPALAVLSLGVVVACGVLVALLAG